MGYWKIREGYYDWSMRGVLMAISYPDDTQPEYGQMPICRKDWEK